MKPVHCGASLSHHLHTICQNHHCSENAAGDREGNSRLATVIATVAVQLTFLTSPHGFKSMLSLGPRPSHPLLQRKIGKTRRGGGSGQVGTEYHHGMLHAVAGYE